MRGLTTEIAAVFVLAGACLAGDPVVSSIRASQREGTKLVDIWYDVADSDGDRLTVALAVTDNGAAVASASLSGDVGAGVAPGKGKHVVWNAGNDWAGKFSASVRVAITADDGRTPAVPAGMVLIPAGTNSGIDPDFGAYSLSVSAFCMDATEVTKAKWDEVRSWAVSNGYGFDNAGSGKASNHPVHTVNWYDCVKWCNARSQKEGRTPCYTVSGSVYKTGQSEPDCNFAATGYRLPTKTEREYAARGGLSSKRFPWGDTITHSQANYYSSSGYSYDVSSTRNFHPTYAKVEYPFTSPVGAFAANGYGLYDMAGNIIEKCNDAGGLFCGGGWSDVANSARCRASNFCDLDSASYYCGFRAVCR
jgi:formylglycine-generating enzyme required for sulfatase activity